MKVCRCASVAGILVGLGLAVSGCSLLYFQRVPDDGYPPCDEPACSGAAPAIVDTALAAGSAVLAVTNLVIGVSDPRLCLSNSGLLCYDLSDEVQTAAGVFAFAAVIYGLSAAFGHAWAGDCKAAWAVYDDSLAQQKECQERRQAKGKERRQEQRQEHGRQAGAIREGDAVPAAQAVVEKHPVQDLTCLPGTRVLGRMPPAGWERYCARVLPSGLVVRHGPSRAWFDNGQVASEGTYRDGERHGRWTFWYVNGQVRLEATYHRGSKVGVWKRWSRNGEALAAP